MDDVAPDVVPGELDRQGLGEGDEGALGRGVGVLGHGEPAECRDGANVDDGSAARSDQVGNAEFRDEEGALEVDGHDPVPVRLCCLGHGPIPILPQDAGVVVEDVQGAEFLHPGVDHPLDVALHPDVPLREDGLAPAPLDPPDRLQPGLGADVSHDDPGAFPGKQDGRLPPLPHAGSGDERHLPLQSHEKDSFRKMQSQMNADERRCPSSGKWKSLNRYLCLSVFICGSKN